MVPLHIDFIADVTCPWCAIGLRSLEQGIAALGGGVPLTLRLHSFELNAGMPLEGEPIAAYAARKSGASPEQMAQRQALIRARAAEVGYRFRERTHVFNTFDAHRLLHQAALEGREFELLRALFDAYHVRGENPARQEVLTATAAEAGLDPASTRMVLSSDAHADRVRAGVREWQARGIDGVPAVVIDHRHLVSGAQPAAVYERALRSLAAEHAQPSAGSGS